jgi:hypothetical protein
MRQAGLLGDLAGSTPSASTLEVSKLRAIRLSKSAHPQGGNRLVFLKELKGGTAKPEGGLPRSSRQGERVCSNDWKERSVAKRS